jgi:signal transduction histidine kinase
VVATWLDQHGVPDAWRLADNLVAGGIDAAWCERAHEALGASALAPGLEWVAATVASKTLLSDLKDAVRRISELVAAVRSYSQMDRASAQRIDVRDGLESTLTMLGHKLKSGVTVVREYADLPQIEAYPGELNQVWTNLIDNAVDAMDGQGTLTVRTRGQGDWVIVEIADTGPGMPPEVAARAFEPFFTTKDVGRGTGLGLDIARRIVVERHGGLIDIDSPAAEGKGTVMRISLPLKPRS